MNTPRLLVRGTKSRLFLVAVACGVALSAGCGGESGGSSSADPKVCSTDNPVEGSDLKGLPEGLPLQEWGTIVRVDRSRGFIGAKAISEIDIVELYPQITRAIGTGGYKQISGENEGFEAEVFFQKGGDTGTFLLRKGPCEGQVTVRLIYGSSPDAQASPSMNTSGKN